MTADEIDALTPEQLRIAVAEKVMGHSILMRWCYRDPECSGWEEIESLYEDDEDDDSLSRQMNAAQRQEFTVRGKQFPCKSDGLIWDVIPDYPNDIAATYAMEAEIERRGLVKGYSRASWDIVRVPEQNLEQFWFACVHATPLQRCRAALKAVFALQPA